jgi:hypothetical protein
MKFASIYLKKIRRKPIETDLRQLLLAILKRYLLLLLL